jgi:hypothetical protein
VPGTPAPFKLRAASYLADRTKVDAGMPQFVLGSVDLVETAGPTQHISRFLPAVRCVSADNGTELYWLVLCAGLVGQSGGQWKS